MRASVDYFHDAWYQEALPITCGRQCNKPNQPADGVSDCYTCSITIHFLENLNNELQQRFDTPNMTAYKGLAILPSKLIRSLNKGSKLCWKEKRLCIANFYKDDV